jgi:anaerobic magnesium-protoporphyrin IX monomethyl ester cyclase
MEAKSHQIMHNSAMTRICLITPPSPFLLDQRVFPALGILKVAAVLEQAGYTVDHLDLTGVSNYEEAAKDYQIEAVFAITATTPQIPAAIRIRQQLRGKTILGGPHATLVNAAAKRGNARAQKALHELLGKFECVVAGDGEKAIFEAIYMTGLIDADDPKSILWQSSKDFTESPWPARHLLDMDSYHYTIDEEKAGHVIGQLGCPMKCAFCSGRNSPMLRRIRLRTPDNIVAEAIHLHHTYGFTGINFFDDELNINREMLTLMRGMRDSAKAMEIQWRLRGFIKSELFTHEQADAMCEAGFKWILVGFESGSDRILANIQKNATREENTRCMKIAHAHGLKVKALMSIGHAGESKDTVRETHEWLLETQPDDLDVTVITPYPGSPYWDEAVNINDNVWRYTSPKSGDYLYMEEVDFTQTADYYKGIAGSYVSHVWTDHLTRSELVEQRDWVELTAKHELGISMPPSAAATMYDHSTGMTPMILRSSK